MDIPSHDTLREMDDAARAGLKERLVTELTELAQAHGFNPAREAESALSPMECLAAFLCDPKVPDAMRERMQGLLNRMDVIRAHADSDNLLSEINQALGADGAAYKRELSGFVFDTLTDGVKPASQKIGIVTAGGFGTGKTMAIEGTLQQDYRDGILGSLFMEGVIDGRGKDNIHQFPEWLIEMAKGVERFNIAPIAFDYMSRCAPEVILLRALGVDNVFDRWPIYEMMDGVRTDVVNRTLDAGLSYIAEGANTSASSAKNIVKGLNATAEHPEFAAEARGYTNYLYMFLADVDSVVKRVEERARQGTGRSIPVHGIKTAAGRLVSEVLPMVSAYADHPDLKVMVLHSGATPGTDFQMQESGLDGYRPTFIVLGANYNYPRWMGSGYGSLSLIPNGEDLVQTLPEPSLHVFDPRMMAHDIVTAGQNAHAIYGLMKEHGAEVHGLPKTPPGVVENLSTGKQFVELTQKVISQNVHYEELPYVTKKNANMAVRFKGKKGSVTTMHTGFPEVPGNPFEKGDWINISIAMPPAAIEGPEQLAELAGRKAVYPINEEAFGRRFRLHHVVDGEAGDRIRQTIADRIGARPSELGEVGIHTSDHNLERAVRLPFPASFVNPEGRQFFMKAGDYLVMDVERDPASGKLVIMNYHGIDATSFERNYHVYSPDGKTPDITDIRAAHLPYETRELARRFNRDQQLTVG